MKRRNFTKLGYFVAATFFAAISPYAAHAACSPGIPCTGYNIDANPTAATDTAFNAAKSGAAAPYDETACDANFMNQIYSRAYMEASRDVIMAEQLIHKPDSVLEYTCFDQQISMVAQHAGPIFSESNKWQNREIELWTAGTDSTNGGTAGDVATTTINTGSVTMFPNQISHSVFDTDRLDGVLEDFLFDTLQTYVDNHFAHTYLGEGTTIDNNIDTTAIGAGSYTCSHMSTLWNIAKCIDFGEDDRFRSFESLVNADPRSIPVACSPSAVASDAVVQGNNSTKLDSTSAALPMPSGGLNTPCPAAGTPVSGVETGFSNDLIRLSTNCDDGAIDYAYASFDPIEAYNQLIKGIGDYAAGTGGASGTITCADPIPTGVPVITYTYNSDPFALPATGPGGMAVLDREMFVHYDHFCPNPGCYYEVTPAPYSYGAALPSATTTGSCVPLP